MLKKLFSWFGLQKKKIPLFVQSIFSYMLVMSISIVALFMVVGQARHITVNHYLVERKYALESSIGAMERQLENFRSLARAMQSSEYYFKVRFLRDNPDRTASADYHFFKLSQEFSLRCSELINAKNSFVYFANSDSVIWREQNYSFEAADYLDRIMLTGKENQPLSSHITSMRNNQYLLPISYVEEDGLVHELLLYLHNMPNNSGIFGMLLTANDIDDLFHISELPQNSQLVISQSKTNEVIYNVGERNASTSNYLIECSIPSLSLTACVYIPQNYFVELTRPIGYLLSIYIIVNVVLCLLISLWLSRKNAASMRRLLQAFTNAVSPDGKCKNEFIMLDHNIQLTRMQNLQLQQQMAADRKVLQLNMLSRLMVQESYSYADEQLAKEYLPSYANGARLICLKFTRSDQLAADDVTSYQSRLALESVLPQDSAIIQMQLNQFIVLLHDHGDKIPKIARWMNEMNEALTPIDLSVNAGVSECFHSLKDLHEAYLHAVYTLHYNSTPPLSVFETPEDECLLRFTDLSAFRNAVVICDDKTAVQLLERFKQLSYHYRWLMQAVRFTLESICSEMRLDVPALQNDSLDTYMLNIIEALLSKHKTDSVKKKSEEVLQYLQNAYADSSLSSDSLAERFGVSRSYLYRIFRESYGTTPSDMLEKIRVEQAQKLLLETTATINDIASMVGYNSSTTFYRAYKKCYGCSPNTARVANETLTTANK